MFKHQKEKRGIAGFKIIAGILIFLLNLLGCIFLIFHPKRWKRFLKGQKKEVKELSTGKEDLGRFCRDSSKLLKDLFIPHQGNSYKPKVLRPKSLIVYVLLAVFVKVAVTGFLFITYPDPAYMAAIVASRMVNLVNASREESDLPPLKINNYLVESAIAKGQDMLENQYFAHDTPDGKKPWQWIDRTNYDYVYAGENLAMDFTSAEVVNSAFLKSPSHRRNILNPKYIEIGIAVLNGELNGHPTILLVEFFGTQRKDISALASAKPTPTENEIEQPIVKNQETPIVAGKQTTGEIPTPPESQTLSPEPPSEGIIVVTTEQKNSRALVDLIIEYSNIFFIAFLIFIFISLLLNIFIKIRVQHSSLILQTIVVFALITAMVLVKFHFIEQVSHQLLIL